MALVSFTLSEEGVGAFNDALMCVNKFSDDVSLEVRKDKVRTARPAFAVPSPLFRVTLG